MQFILSKNSNRHSVLSTAFYIISSNFTIKQLNSHCNSCYLSLGAKTNQIIIRLKVQPKLRAGTKSIGKQPGSLRCNPPLATHNFIDPLNRYANMPGKGHLR